MENNSPQRVVLSGYRVLVFKKRCPYLDTMNNFQYLKKKKKLLITVSRKGDSFLKYYRYVKSIKCSILITKVG